MPAVGGTALLTGAVGVVEEQRAPEPRGGAGTGEFFFDVGSVPGWAGTTAQDANAGSGQTNINGWTIQFDETSTRFTYDATGHGMSVSPAYIRSS